MNDSITSVLGRGEVGFDGVRERLHCPRLHKHRPRSLEDADEPLPRAAHSPERASRESNVVVHLRRPRHERSVVHDPRLPRLHVVPHHGAVHAEHEPAWAARHLHDEPRAREAPLHDALHPPPNLHTSVRAQVRPARELPAVLVAEREAKRVARHVRAEHDVRRALSRLRRRVMHQAASSLVGAARTAGRRTAIPLALRPHLPSATERHHRGWLRLDATVRRCRR
mmetsp:Transcript_22820/g.74316  ORF Transcript_22820/g.74316 Transcript_22820/m.74316 type:complete len:225 (+) Transcript_22820:67-741(+)